MESQPVSARATLGRCIHCQCPPSALHSTAHFLLFATVRITADMDRLDIRYKMQGSQVPLVVLSL